MTFEPKAGVYYQLVAKHSGQCLQPGDEINETWGERIVTEGPELTPETNQQFQLCDDGNGYFGIFVRQTGRPLVIAGEQVLSGADKFPKALIRMQFDLLDKFKFKFEPAGDGHYYVRAKGNNLRLDTAGQTTNGVVNVIPRPAGDNQQFKLEPLGDGYYRITAKGNDKCLSEKPGIGLVLSEKVPSNDHQLFTFQSANDGYYRLVNKRTGRCLQIKNPWSNRKPVKGDPFERFRVVIESDVDPSNTDQLFSLETTEDGYCRLIAKHNGDCVDVGTYLLGEGTLIQLAPKIPFRGNQQFWPISDETRAALQFVSLIALSDMGQDPKKLEEIAEKTKPEDAAKWAADNLGLVFSGPELASVATKLKSLTTYMQSNVPSASTPDPSSPLPDSSTSETFNKSNEKSIAAYQTITIKAAGMAGAPTGFGALFKVSLVFTYSLLKSAGGGDSEARSAMQGALGAMLGTSKVAALDKGAPLTGVQFLDTLFYTVADVAVGMASGVREGTFKAADVVKRIFSW